MGKTSAAVKARYNAKSYDRITIFVPKGRKETIETLAHDRGLSVNGLANMLLQRETGLSDDDWKVRES